ncbi:MAG: hypothetical protein JNJ78_15300 [Anaerolineae bacterium]|nr:hypothetical protein [Anaerolineae bacterium]
MLSMGGASYQYDGEGRRTPQTVSSIVTKYLLDIQPGLAVVLSQTEGSDVTRFVHAPRGIHARQDASSDWHWTAQDGLGTVRMETNNSAGVEGAQNLDPFGNLIGLNGTIGKLLQDLPRHHPEYQIQIMQVSNHRLSYIRVYGHSDRQIRFCPRRECRNTGRYRDPGDKHHKTQQSACASS